MLNDIHSPNLTWTIMDPKPLIPRNKHRPQGVSLGLSDLSKVSIPILGDAHTTMLKRELHYCQWISNFHDEIVG